MTSTADPPAAAASVSAQARDTAIAVRLVFLRAAYEKLLAQRDGRKHKALYDAIKAVAGTTLRVAAAVIDAMVTPVACFWVVAWGCCLRQQQIASRAVLPLAGTAPRPRGKYQEAKR